jgi:hypothetical protein
MNIKIIVQLKLFVEETGSVCVGVCSKNEEKSGKYKGGNLVI